MSVQTISATAHTSAPTELVWEVIADATRYPEWSKLDSAEYERTGDPAPHGTGAIRVFGSGRYTLREEVTAYAENRHLDYILLDGMPVRNYRARISLDEDAPGETAIHWRAEFESKLPGLGGLIARRLERSLTDLVKDAATEARRRLAAGDSSRTAPSPQESP